jgi:ribonuclease HII
MLVGGIDEVGRGCLAGPVIAAAVVLDPDCTIEGLADSKVLSPGKRSVLAEKIMSHALAWAIGRAEAREIDSINILQASLLAMRRAFMALPIRPAKVKIDGKHVPSLPCQSEAIVGGDALDPSISAASILAKVFRDREMAILDVIYPGYDFAVHKAYPTQRHRAALSHLGPSPVHRTSFSPVSESIRIVGLHSDAR